MKTEDTEVLGRDSRELN